MSQDYFSLTLVISKSEVYWVVLSPQGNPTTVLNIFLFVLTCSHPILKHTAGTQGASASYSDTQGLPCFGNVESTGSSVGK